MKKKLKKCSVILLFDVENGCRVYFDFKLKNKIFFNLNVFFYEIFLKNLV